MNDREAPDPAPSRRTEEAQARLAAIVESSEDAIIGKTLDGRILSWNGGAERLFGYPAEEIIGEPITLIVPTERLDEERSILARLGRGERVEHFDTVRVTKGGERVDVSLMLSPIRDRDGTVVAISTIARDVTLKKRAEQRLVTQYEVTRVLASATSLADAAPRIVQTVCGLLDWDFGALWTMDDEESVLRCLDAWHTPDAPVPRFEAATRERVFHAGEGLPGRVWASAAPRWIPDVTRDENFPRAAIALAEGLHGACAFPIVLDGRVLGAVEFYSHEVRPPDPALLQMMTAIGSQAGQFIERKRAEDGLRRSEQRSRFLADVSITFAELLNHESTLTRLANLAVPSFADWCAVHLRDAEGVMRCIALAHVDPSTLERGRDLFLRDALAPGGPFGLAEVLRTGRSEWAPALVESRPGGSVQGQESIRTARRLGLRSYICVPLRSRGQTIGALTFVTAESGRTHDLMDLAAAEDLSSRAVVAIESARLLETLRETDQRKDEFLAMLAHELRNPLAPIRNAAQIVRARAEGVPDLQWSSDVIDRQVHQMTRLIDDLLDVSRITRGKITLRKERVVLSAVVNSAVEASRALITKCGHKLTVTVPPQPVVVDGDATRLAQVVSNLLNNAAKYTDHGGHLGLAVEPGQHHVVIRVTDDGIGIPADMLPRIFEIFTQVDRSLERSEGGLGIGLTLVQRLVEMHGGTVEATSDGPGRGSQFVVRLPLAVPPRHEAAPAPAADALAAPARRRVLVVDDNRDSADSLCELLQLRGNEAFTAHDGLEAVEAAATLQPDVIVLDIGLPRLNGYEVAQRVRQMEGGADIMLIAVTGWGQDEDRRRSKESGFDHHLTKPIEFSALLELLATREPSDRPRPARERAAG